MWEGGIIERICKRDEKGNLLLTALRSGEVVGRDDKREATALILR